MRRPQEIAWRGKQTIRQEADEEMRFDAMLALMMGRFITSSSAADRTGWTVIDIIATQIATHTIRVLIKISLLLLSRDNQTI